MLHGGDIYRNRVSIDFSVNINPLGIPASVEDALRKAIDHCGQYPDILAERLGEAVSDRMGISREYLLFGNGASELFLAIVRAVNPGKTVIPVPSFFGYERAAQSFPGEIFFYGMKERAGYSLDEGIMDYLTEGSLLFLANPNNPVGNLLENTFLERLAKYCRQKQSLMVIDECFLEFTAEEGQRSFKSRLEDYPNVIVVRAFTKSFAMPGVRLGYLACGDQELKRRIEGQLPEWNLSVFAQAAGLAACGEKEYMEKTLRLVEAERKYLMREFVGLGIHVYPSEADYLLLETDLPLYEALLDMGILIRDCSNFRGLRKGYYRIAVKQHTENEILVNAITEIKEKYHATDDRICTPGGDRKAKL